MIADREIPSSLSLKSLPKVFTGLQLVRTGFRISLDFSKWYAIMSNQKKWEIHEAFSKEPVICFQVMSCRPQQPRATTVSVRVGKAATNLSVSPLFLLTRGAPCICIKRAPCRFISNGQQYISISFLLGMSYLQYSQLSWQLKHSWKWSSWNTMLQWERRYFSISAVKKSFTF